MTTTRQYQKCFYKIMCLMILDRNSVWKHCISKYENVMRVSSCFWRNNCCYLELQKEEYKQIRRHSPRANLAHVPQCHLPISRNRHTRLPRTPQPKSSHSDPQENGRRHTPAWTRRRLGKNQDRQIYLPLSSH